MGTRFITRPPGVIDFLLLGLTLLFIYGDYRIWSNGAHRMAIVFIIAIAVSAWFLSRTRNPPNAN
jgi:hypothetical protein